MALVLSGCGMSIPADPDGALEQVENGVLRVGVSPDGPVVERVGDEVSGPLALVIEDFARQHRADVEWEFGSEESLVMALEAGEIDIAIGGMTSDTPWSDRVGVSRGYPQLDPRERDLVVFVPLGQNRLLSELERFLDGEGER